LTDFFGKTVYEALFALHTSVRQSVKLALRWKDLESTQAPKKLHPSSRLHPKGSTTMKITCKSIAGQSIELEIDAAMTVSLPP
jgi:hypothetical protein